MQREAQEKYYAADKEHKYLRYCPDDRHVRNLIDHMLAFCNIDKRRSILEIGSGSGRFTIHLLKDGFDVTCVDISEALLDRLKSDAGKAGIPSGRIKMLRMPIEEMDEMSGGPYDAIIGFFMLHHLDVDNLGPYMSKFRKLLKPGGRICFIEPNRLNPLFAVQMLLYKDVKFRYEKGLFRLSRGLLDRALKSTGYSNITFRNFGFCPPQVVNYFPAVLKVEKKLEGAPLLNRFLPFLLVTAESGEGQGSR